MSRSAAWRRAKDAAKETKRTRIEAIRAERRPDADSWKSYPAEKRWKLSAKDVAWADIVFVMETKHRDRLRAAFPRAMQYKPTHVLDIEDDYAFMDAELVEILETAVPPLIG